MTEPDLLDSVRSRLAGDGGLIEPHRVAEAIRSEGRIVTDATVLGLVDALHRESSGAGALEPLLRLPGVTDVLVNGPDAVFVDDGGGLRRAPLTFPDDGSVRALAQRLASSAGRRLDDASPYADVRLPDGTRLHAVLAPVAQPGTCLSLRVPARAGVRLDDLAEAGLADDAGLRLLQRMIAARLAFVIVGGTGSGKTTLLGALLAEVDPGERIVVVEDSAELRPAHPHVVSLEARPANAEGQGAIVMRDLVRQALRMRPDRLVVGEVRGAEVVELLAALNTGHQGGCGTLHANGPADVVARLEALGIAAGLTREGLHAQAASALDVVVHLRRDRDGRRRLAELGVVHQVHGTLAVDTAVTFPRGGAPAEAGPAAPLLAALLERGSG